MPLTTAHASGTLETVSWDETTWDGRAWTDVTGRKLTSAVVEARLHGDIEASSQQRWLMVYPDGGESAFVGLEEVHGTLAGRTGGCTLRHTGTFADGVLSSDFEVVAGSGTGELAGLAGRGTYRFEGEHGDPTLWELDWSLPSG